MNKRPKYTITFDSGNQTYEESKNAFIDYTRFIIKAALEDSLSKFKNKKEREETLHNLSNFNSKLLSSLGEAYDKEYKK